MKNLIYLLLFLPFAGFGQAVYTAGGTTSLDSMSVPGNMRVKGSNVVSGTASAINFIPGWNVTVTSSVTVTFTSATYYNQFFTGSSVDTIYMPVTSTLVKGWPFEIVNNSSASLYVKSSGGGLILTIPSGLIGEFIDTNTSLTTAAAWYYHFANTPYTAGFGLANTGGVLSFVPSTQLTFSGQDTFKSNSIYFASGLTLSTGTYLSYGNLILAFGSGSTNYYFGDANTNIAPGSAKGQDDIGAGYHALNFDDSGSFSAIYGANSCSGALYHGTYGAVLGYNSITTASVTANHFISIGDNNQLAGAGDLNEAMFGFSLTGTNGYATFGGFNGFLFQDSVSVIYNTIMSTAPKNGFVLINNTASTGSAQYSPSLFFQGSDYEGGSKPCGMRIECVPGNTAGVLNSNLQIDADTNNTFKNAVFQLSNLGVLTLSGGLIINSAGTINNNGGAVNCGLITTATNTGLTIGSGGKLTIPATGTNQIYVTATLSSGTVSVSNTLIDASSKILCISYTSTSLGAGNASVYFIASAITSGSCTITAYTVAGITNTTDNSTIQFLIIN